MLEGESLNNDLKGGKVGDCGWRRKKFFGKILENLEEKIGAGKFIEDLTSV
jgi:hypothetical protein